jgi:hypothetical protein
MFTPMDSMFLWKRKKMRRSEDFLVYNDSLCIQFNKNFVDTWTQPLCTVLDFTNLHFTSPKKSETSWSFPSKNNEVLYFTKLHFTSFNEVMDQNCHELHFTKKISEVWKCWVLEVSVFFNFFLINSVHDLISHLLCPLKYRFGSDVHPVYILGIQIGMFRPIRVDYTNCLQVAIKTHSFIRKM